MPVRTPNVTDSPVPERVQVVPLGFEYARLREPVRSWKADRVVAIEYVEDTDVPYIDAFLEELAADDRVDLEVRTCDIFDLYDALGAVAAAIDDHADDDVYVNVSAGSKITAIAGTIACMATGATPVYARPDYGPDDERIPDEPLHDAVAETFALPTYPIERPSHEHVAVLEFVAESGDGEGRYEGVTKGELLDFGAREELPFVAESDAETRKGLYRRLDSRVLSPLLERQYVAVSQVGREKYVSLTEQGENVLRAFDYVL